MHGPSPARRTTVDVCVRLQARWNQPSKWVFARRSQPAQIWLRTVCNLAVIVRSLMPLPALDDVPREEWPRAKRMHENGLRCWRSREDATVVLDDLLDPALLEASMNGEAIVLSASDCGASASGLWVFDDGAGDSASNVATLMAFMCNEV